MRFRLALAAVLIASAAAARAAPPSGPPCDRNWPHWWLSVCMSDFSALDANNIRVIKAMQAAPEIMLPAYRCLDERLRSRAYTYLTWPGSFGRMPIYGVIASGVRDCAVADRIFRLLPDMPRPGHGTFACLDGVILWESYTSRMDDGQLMSMAKSCGELVEMTLR